MNHSVFKDLAPSYIENLTSEETNREIERHLAQCEECRKYLHDMQEDLLVERKNERKKEERNINFFKKVQSRQRKKMANIIISLLSVLLLLIFSYYFLFIRMWIADTSDVQTTVQKRGTTVTLSFQSKNEGRYLLARDEAINEEYIDWIIIYEKRDDFTTPVNLKKSMKVTYTFLDENTLLLDNGEQRKLTAEDKITIQYKDRTEEIAVKDLYVSEHHMNMEK
ncbi:hypothetical protein CD798_13660 [Bacillaceae bacterium SAOS 7]|nr:hypothetical protein CD798_13660 [Bacillaceae bacterium SAOS 7]